MNVHKSNSGDQTWLCGKSFINGGLIYMIYIYLWETKYQWGNGDVFPLPYLIELIQLGPALEPQHCHLGHFSGHAIRKKKCP
jgi:hypothetical protein